MMVDGDDSQQNPLLKSEYGAIHGPSVGRRALGQDVVYNGSIALAPLSAGIGTLLQSPERRALHETGLVR
jgi:hypothetical protein